MKTLEVAKSSHEKFCLVIDPDGIAKLRLYIADGRGNWKPTPEAFGFHVKHAGKLRALLAGLEGAK